MSKILDFLIRDIRFLSKIDLDQSTNIFREIMWIIPGDPVVIEGVGVYFHKWVLLGESLIQWFVRFEPVKCKHDMLGRTEFVSPPVGVVDVSRFVLKIP